MTIDHTTQRHYAARRLAEPIQGCLRNSLGRRNGGPRGAVGLCVEEQTMPDPTRRDITFAELRRIAPRIARVLESEDVLDAVAGRILEELNEPPRPACGATPPCNTPHGNHVAGSRRRISSVSAGAGGSCCYVGNEFESRLERRSVLAKNIKSLDDLEYVDFVSPRELDIVSWKYHNDVENAQWDGEEPSDIDEELVDEIATASSNPYWQRNPLLMNLTRLFRDDVLASGVLDQVFDYTEIGSVVFGFIKNG